MEKGRDKCRTEEKGKMTKSRILGEVGTGSVASRSVTDQGGAKLKQKGDEGQGGQTCREEMFTYSSNIDQVR